MSEAPEFIRGQKIIYTQPPKEPENVVGVITEVHPTYIVVEHLEKAKNSITIPTSMLYTIVNPDVSLTDVSLTEVPTIKKITYKEIIYGINNKVSYMLKGHSQPLIGRIKKITIEKGNFKLIIKHLNKEQQIPIDQKDLKLVEGNPNDTDYPEASQAVIPFNIGDIVSYSLVGAVGKSIGKIIEINFTRVNTTFIIEHKDDNKSMTYNIGQFEKVDPPPPPESYTPAPRKLEINDIIYFTYKKVKNTKGIILSFKPTNKPPLIVVNINSDTFVEIPYDQQDIRLPNSDGNKKYTLEDENKYRLKYAKYKTKYLLLK